MKKFRLLLATGLALTTLVGVTLALTWWQPSPARAEDAINAPAAPQTLPPPWLSDDDVADAPFDNPPAPTVDGLITPGEYAGAGKVTFPGYGGDVEVFFKQDAITLYVAFELPDKVNKNPWPDASLLLDTNHDGGSNPQADDFRFLVWRNGPAAEWQGNGSGWISNASITWTYGLTETMSGWSVEFGIPFTKLGITAGTFKDMGLALSNGGPGPTYFWPAGVSPGEPDTWGSLVSSSGTMATPSGWDTFYWKPGPWEDYAPSGMPDFDQKQDAWSVGPISTHCGPVAMANSLWWFDSKFETPDHPPLPISDTYRLVRSYADWDDHDPNNVIPLVDDLANRYFGTNQGIVGTNVISMFFGTHQYLRDLGLWDDYIVTLVISPTFEWVADEVMRSEDVILLLGFYEQVGPGMWNRVGGHYVTIAGVDPTARSIAFSDPFVDNAEQGGPGRVLSGTLTPHQPIPGHTPDVHNDAGNISHDVYPITSTNSPGGTWGPEDYLWDLFIEMFGVNPHPFIETLPWSSNPIQVEVEFALTVSPYTWKSSGEWQVEGDDPLWGYWQEWQDYAPNGIPDFDEKQDNWGYLDPSMTWHWSFCGPAAAANSLWWFDSKFEPNPAGPPIPPPYGTIPYNDNYPLVQSYAPMLPLWDDHDPLNVDDPATPWPPGGEFVEDLALYFDTDGQQTGLVHAGTVITDLYTGVVQYITDHGLRQGYVITQVKSPDFWWVAEEIEVSEDVILLLGFWEQIGPGEFQRVGGHYVTLPGVDKQGGFVAFSDPYYDGAEYAWPYAYPGGWPTVMGRVADGWLYPHPPYHTHVYTTHNDAGNVSHDVYRVVGSDSPGGSWGPGEYVEGGYIEENFLGQNGDSVSYSGGSVQAEVDWAVSVSPVADLWVKKTVTPPIALPGDWITFTITFANEGSLPAEDVVITDVLPSELLNPSWNAWASNGLTVTARPAITYVWDLPDLAWQEWGLITISAQADPALSWPASITLTNRVTIATSSVEQYQIPEWANVATATLAVQTADVAITKTMGIAVPPLRPGDWATFTLSYGNDGPATAASVVISDLLSTPPLTTTGARYTYTNNYGGLLFPVTGYTFAWNAGDLAALNTGTITITAQVDPNLATGGRYTNTAQIATSSHDRDPSNNQADQGLDVCIPPAGANFTMSTSTPQTGQTVYFTGTATGSPPLTYTWDLGDGHTGQGQQIGHTYVQSNTYTVWMTVTNSCGQDVASHPITVTGPPFVPTYGATLTPTARSVVANPGDTLVYTHTLRNTGNVADTYTVTVNSTRGWTTLTSPGTVNLSPGTTAAVTVTTQIPLMVTPGMTDVATIQAASWTSPTVQAQAVDTTTVCASPSGADFTWSPTTPDVGQTVTFTGTASGSSPITYTWAADDGWSASGSTTTHAFTTAGLHTVWMTATNSCGQDVVSKTLSACDPVGNVDFQYAPPDPRVNQTIGFTGTATGGTPITYTWAADDGWSTGGVTATHAFATPGNHTVWLTAANSCSQDVVSKTLLVCDLVGNVSIQYAPPDTGLNQTIGFTGTATGGTPITYTWAADDGWSAGGVTATHAFATLGNHTVWLTAANSCSQDYASAVIFVREYGVHLQPPSGGATGYQGNLITYTLTLFNTGNVTDDYTITGNVAGEPWPTDWPTTVSSVAGGGTALLDVTVQITSSSGSSYATITATSQSNANKKATSLLTTTATTQPLFHDVEIAPPTAAQTGDVGTTVTYTLWVTNTGTISDYINLSPSGYSWGTVLSVYGFNLGPGEGQPLEVYVQIPGGASSGAQDVAMITARSAGDPTVTDNSILTTTAYVPRYGLDLTPLVAQQTGHPGDVMTYTLTVRNTGERDDTYTLSQAGNTWPTTLSVSSVGPIPPNGIAQFEALVHIPAGVVSGTASVFDTVQVTATSQKDGSKSDTAVLTTTAIASSQPITRGVTLAAADTALDGPLGAWITYTLRLTNTGNVADFFNLTRQGSTWPVDLSIYGLSLGAGLGTDVQAYVWIPVTASGGDTDTVTIEATSSNDTTATDSVLLTSTARTYRIYLPLVARNYQ